MEIIQSTQHARRPSLAPLLGGTVLGTVLIVGGVVLAYLALATPVLRSVIPAGRFDPGQAATGILVWAIALVAPAGFVLLGASRLVRILTAVRGRIPRRSPALRALDGLSDDVIVAQGISLPDGRPVTELVIGPFGAAVVRGRRQLADDRGDAGPRGSLGAAHQARLDQHREPARAGGAGRGARPSLAGA